MWYVVITYLLVGFGLWCWLERGVRALVVTSLWPVVLGLFAWVAWTQRAQRARAHND